jgi:hypothetical protein
MGGNGMTSIYFVKKGPRPDWHKAPYHQFIICTRRALAKWEAGASSERSWIWEQPGGEGAGWLLWRWKGLDLDYGPVVHGFNLPDGTEAAFSHPLKNGEPWCLLAETTWWSSRKMPEWLHKVGVKYPTDAFTQQRILDTEADDGCMGFCNRTAPAWWPAPADAALSGKE